MNYKPDFYSSFMERTKKNLNDYKGEFEATLPINSLLGLLIVPLQKFFDNLPSTRVKELDQLEWGPISNWLSSPMKCDLGHEHLLTLRQFTRRLRNAVAHFHIKPYPEQGDVEGFSFVDGSFKARIPKDELKIFITKLASELAKLQRATAPPC